MEKVLRDRKRRHSDYNTLNKFSRWSWLALCSTSPFMFLPNLFCCILLIFLIPPFNNLFFCSFHVSVYQMFAEHPFCAKHYSKFWELENRIRQVSCFSEVIQDKFSPLILLKPRGMYYLLFWVKSEKLEQCLNGHQ